MDNSNSLEGTAATNTVNPQTASPANSITGNGGLQNTNNASLVNNSSSGLSIPLQSNSNLSTAAIGAPVSIKHQSHPINASTLIPAGILFVFAVAVSIYIYIDSHKANKYS